MMSEIEKMGKGIYKTLSDGRNKEHGDEEGKGKGKGQICFQPICILISDGRYSSPKIMAWNMDGKWQNQQQRGGGG
jgi:hypothetical protein